MIWFLIISALLLTIITIKSNTKTRKTCIAEKDEKLGLNTNREKIFSEPDRTYRSDRRITAVKTTEGLRADPNLAVDRRYERPIVILDTCYMMKHADFLNDFGRADAVIPVGVLGELDRIKSQDGEKGKLARAAVTKIKDLMRYKHLIHNDGFLLKQHSKWPEHDTALFVATEPPVEIAGTNIRHADDQVLCEAIQERRYRRNVIVATTDNILEVRCLSHGIEVYRGRPFDFGKAAA